MRDTNKLYYYSYTITVTLSFCKLHQCHINCSTSIQYHHYCTGMTKIASIINMQITLPVTIIALKMCYNDGH